MVAGVGATQKLTLRAKQRGAVTVPLTASAAGNGAVKINVSGPGGFALERSYTLTVRPPAQMLARRTVKPIAKGESLTLSSDMFADLVPGTGGVSISVGFSTALDAASLLAALDRYPYRCSEQITSRAMPLLYVNELASEAHLALDGASTSASATPSIALLARQDSNGSFGLWSVGGDDVWLDSYVTDFLTRARERNFAVPDTAFKLALDRLRNFVANTADPSKNGGRDLAYALYVLARNGAAPIGDLRYLADAKLDALTRRSPRRRSPRRSRMIGDRTPRRAGLCGGARHDRAAVGATGSVRPRGLRLDPARCRGAGDARLAKAARAPATVQAAVQRVEAARAHAASDLDAGRRLAACWRRARMAKDAGSVSLDVDGEAVQRRALPQHPRERPEGAAAKSPTPATAAVQAVVTVTGAPLTPEPAAEKRLQDRAALLHARRRCRSIATQGQAEHALRGGAQDHRSRSRNSAA